MLHEYTTHHQVSTFDVDFNKRLRYANLLKYMQDAAQVHATLLGVGHSYLENYHYAWILGRLKIKMKRILKMGEKFSLTTYPGPPMKYVYPRYFVFKDEKGQVIGSASSLWTIFDVNKREVVMDLAKIPYPTLSTVEKALDHPKQILVENCPDQVSYQTKYSDIDTNMHANNTNYVEWMFNLVPLSMLQHAYPRSLQINYLQEIAYLETLTIHFEIQENQTKFFGYSGSDLKFSCEMEWEGEEQ